MATATSMNSEPPRYCVELFRWTRWAPMTWVWSLLGYIPAWACRVRPCCYGWRRFIPRYWTRLLPRSVRWEIAAHLPRFLTQKDISPDCVNCRRFLANNQRPSFEPTTTTAPSI